MVRLTMSRFRYRLEAAFEQLTRAELACRCELVRARCDLAAEERSADLFAARAAATRAACAGFPAAPAREFAAFDAHACALAARETECLGRVAALAHSVARARVRWERCERRRAALERHRARASSEHRRREELRDEAELEERSSACLALLLARDAPP
jgi:hypothetical protein